MVCRNQARHAPTCPDTPQGILAAALPFSPPVAAASATLMVLAFAAYGWLVYRSWFGRWERRFVEAWEGDGPSVRACFTGATGRWRGAGRGIWPFMLRRQLRAGGGSVWRASSLQAESIKAVSSHRRRQCSAVEGRRRPVMENLFSYLPCFRLLTKSAHGF
jgi:hypothetical protein